MGMSTGCLVVVRMAEAGAGADEMAANREVWTQANSEYADGHAYRAWAAEDITWGIFDVPERQVGVLGEVRGLDVVELGCGTEYLSAWLARRGARPTGVDVTSAQLASARRCQDRFGITFPLIEADAADVPLPAGSFDLAISECGASLWCDPACWVPEAARLPRPGGKLVFHTTTILVTVCSPGPDGPPGQELLRPQRQARRLATAREGSSSTPATASGSRSCAAAASSSTRCTNCTLRPMLPIIPTTRWPAPDGRAGGRPRKYGLPASPATHAHPEPATRRPDSACCARELARKPGPGSARAYPVR
jgi:SAM-dependent methyltransferase